MLFRVSNLSHFVPTAATLTFQGSGVVTKALSALSISGDTVTVTLSSADLAAIGSVAYMQLEITAGGTYRTQVVKVDPATAIVSPVLTLNEVLTSHYITAVSQLKALIDDMEIRETRLLMISRVQGFCNNKLSGSFRGYITKTDSVESDLMGFNALSCIANIRVSNTDASFMSCYKVDLTQI